MKKILALALALCMVFSLAAVAAHADDKVTITVLRPGDEEKVASFMEPAVKAFMEENPDIEVKVMYESWAGWIQTYPTYFEADTQPDVIFWWDNKLHDSSAESHLVNIEPYVSEEFVKRIPESVWNLVDTGDMEGIVYVPSSVDSFVLYYNRDVFEQAGLGREYVPTTWDELLEACKAITEKTDAAGIGVPAITGSEVLEEWIGLFINQATNAPILDEGSMPLFATDKGLEALKFVESLVPYLQPSPTEYGRGELRALLRDGKVGMIIDGPWAIPGFISACGENLDDPSVAIGVADVPVAPNGLKIDWAGTNGWIASREATAEASAKFIEFLMSPDVLEAHHIAYGSAPLYEKEFDNPKFQYDYWKTFYNTTQEWTLFGMIGKNSPTPAAYYTALEEVWQQLVLGQLDAETTMYAAAEAGQNITARNS